jgi:hypothetical protein
MEQIEIDQIHFKRDSNGKVLVTNSSDFLFAESANELSVFDCIHYEDLYNYLSTTIGNENFNFCELNSLIRKQAKYNEGNTNFGHSVINRLIKHYHISKDSSHLTTKLTAKLFKEIYFPNDSILILDSINLSKIYISYKDLGKSILELSKYHLNDEQRASLICELDFQNKKIEYIIKQLDMSDECFYLMVKQESQYFILIEINSFLLFKKEALGSIKILNPEVLTLFSIYKDRL